LRFRPLSIASSCLPPSRSRFRFPPSVGGLDAWRRRFILRLPDRREFAYTESIKLTGSRFLRNPILRERHPYNSRNDQQRVNYLYALCSPVCNSAQVDSFTDRQRKTTPANALALRRSGIPRLTARGWLRPADGAAGPMTRSFGCPRELADAPSDIVDSAPPPRSELSAILLAATPSRRTMIC
jgi:hypothetical protein